MKVLKSNYLTMLAENHIPKIEPCFGNRELAINKYYREVLLETLKKVLPSFLFSEKTTVNQKDQFDSLLPIMLSIPFAEDPHKVSFFILAKYRSNIFKFFFEMITRWLVPGKRLNVILVYGADFRMPELSSELFTLCEIVVQVEDSAELALIDANLPVIEAEVRLGVESSYYARRILEIKGITGDEKTRFIQEHIAHLVRRLPHAFSSEVFSEMQHVLVICRDEFKAVRDSRHLSRIISIQYLFLRALHDAVVEAPTQRHLSLKLFKSLVAFSSGVKSVLGMLVGINFIRDKEFFDKKHLFAAVKGYIPTAQVIEGSFFVNRRSAENIAVLYLELEKSDGNEFSSQEISLLREKLPSELKERIEQLMHPVFMPRNEEELMRNILVLSRQLKYVRDIPQVIVSFDEQTHTHISFTVVLVRIAAPNAPTIQELFSRGDSFLEYIPERTHLLAPLRKKYCREATVFRVKFLKDRFLRRDHALDLYKARQAVISELSTVIGEFRDYNGGVILKQNELLDAFKEQLGEKIRSNELLLEHFFFSLTPLVMRMMLEPEALKMLYLMLLKAIEGGKGWSEEYLVCQELDFVFLIIKISHFWYREKINQALGRLNLLTTELAYTSVVVHEVTYDGYIYRCDDAHKQEQFLDCVKGALARETTHDSVIV